MLILKLHLCDYEKLEALEIRVNEANAKLATIKGNAKIKGFTVYAPRSVTQVQPKPMNMFCCCHFIKILFC